MAHYALMGQQQHEYSYDYSEGGHGLTISVVLQPLCYRFTCESCHAEPGSPCVTYRGYRTGRYAPKTHSVRLAAQRRVLYHARREAETLEWVQRLDAYRARVAALEEIRLAGKAKAYADRSLRRKYGVAEELGIDRRAIDVFFRRGLSETREELLEQDRREAEREHDQAQREARRTA